MASATGGDEDHVVEHEEEFDFDCDDDEANETIQTIIDEYEDGDQGVSIDVGGDDEWYEFNFVDGCDVKEVAAFQDLAKKFLDDVAAALRDIDR
jgi:hypothetical protein